MKNYRHQRQVVPLNTLEQTLLLAHTLVLDLTRKGSKASRSYRIFSALASEDREALAAFFIWRARGEVIKELTDNP